MHKLLRSVIFLDTVFEAKSENETRTMMSVVLNRKVMSCEVVRTLDGYIISLIDAWFVHDDTYHYVTDWKHSVTLTDGPTSDACWTKQSNTIVEFSSSDRAMLRIPVKILLSKEKGVLQYFGKKRIENREFAIPGAIDLLASASDEHNECVIEILNRICDAAGVSEDIANEI